MDLDAIRKVNIIKEIIKTIIHDNLKPDSGQACASAQDKRHKDQICGAWINVTLKIGIAMGYAGFIN